MPATKTKSTSSRSKKSPAKARSTTKSTRARSRKGTDKAPADYLQDALDDLEKASDKAGKDVSASIDSARDRIKEARGDISDRGQDQMKELREQLGGAADDALRELGRWAIRAQRSPEALAELSKEITKRKGQVKA